MPSDIGGQSISLKYQAPGNSAEVNERFLNIRPTGIYSGGVLTVVDGSHASLSPAVCEIGDDTYQVRVETTTAVNIAVGTATPYVVLRWSYTGTTLDYMEVLAVSSASIQSTDLVVAKCSFAGVVLNGFDYGDSTYPRSVPNVQNLWLKVIPKGSSLKAMILPGYYQSHTGSVHISLQETDALVPPTANSKIYLVYLDIETGAVAIDSSGTEAASPSAPSYNGRMVLAEITLSSTGTEITDSDIKDVRPFVTPGRQLADETTITSDANGKLKTVDPQYLVLRTIGDQLSNQSAWTAVTAPGAVKQSGISWGSGVWTLTAGEFYKISYCVVFERQSGSPEFKARLRVVSGDSSWWFADDAYNVSIQEEEAPDVLEAQVTLSGTFIILPASTTTMSLEVITRDPNGQYGQVTAATVSVWT